MPPRYAARCNKLVDLGNVRLVDGRELVPPAHHRVGLLDRIRVACELP